MRMPRKSHHSSINLAISQRGRCRECTLESFPNSRTFPQALPPFHFLSCFLLFYLFLFFFSFKPEKAFSSKPGLIRFSEFNCPLDPDAFTQVFSTLSPARVSVAAARHSRDLPLPNKAINRSFNPYLSKRGGEIAFRRGKERKNRNQHDNSILLYGHSK